MLLNKSVVQETPRRYCWGNLGCPVPRWQLFRLHWHGFRSQLLIRASAE